MLVMLPSVMHVSGMPRLAVYKVLYGSTVFTVSIIYAKLPPIDVQCICKCIATKVLMDLAT